MGCDLSDMAVKIVKCRTERELRGLVCEVVLRKDLSRRTDHAELPDYRTHNQILYGAHEGVSCGCDIHFSFRRMTVDHATPRKKGGTDHGCSLQSLRSACSSKKRTRKIAEFRARGMD